MTNQVQILFLAANPADTDKVSLDDEARTIDRALREAEFGKNFNLESQWAVRFNELQGHFLRYKPNIVHFSGHGSTASEIIVNDDSGASHPVPTNALSQLFSVFKAEVKCVVLNACYSEQQAKAIANHIDCVIGMNEAIGDKASINFARSFYQALAYGKNVKAAFILGCNQIGLANLNQENTPQLLSKTGVDPEKIVFAPTTQEAGQKPADSTAFPKKQKKKTTKIVTITESKKQPKPVNAPEIGNKPYNANPESLGSAFSGPNTSGTGTLVDIQQGFNLLLWGRFDEALKYFDSVLRANPQIADAWCGKGMVLLNLYLANFNTNLLYDAINCFDKALGIIPQHTLAWTYKGNCLVNLSVNSPNVNRLNEALNCYDNALRSNPQNAEAWVGKGTCFFNMHLISRDINFLYEAVKCFDVALNINPQYAEAWNKKTVAQNAIAQWNAYRPY
jgi:tetratricopeptide (TPR) repeat protein